MILNLTVTEEHIVLPHEENMRYWSYNDYWIDEDEVMHSFVATKSDEEIINEYYEYWSQKVKEAGKEELICEENCIEDWVEIHWAWESKND